MMRCVTETLRLTPRLQIGTVRILKQDEGVKGLNGSKFDFLRNAVQSADLVSHRIPDLWGEDINISSLLASLMVLNCSMESRLRF